MALRMNSLSQAALPLQATRLRNLSHLKVLRGSDAEDAKFTASPLTFPSFIINSSGKSCSTHVLLPPPPAHLESLSSFAFHEHAETACSSQRDVHDSSFGGGAALARVVADTILSLILLIFKLPGMVISFIRKESTLISEVEEKLDEAADIVDDAAKAVGKVAKSIEKVAEVVATDAKATEELMQKVIKHFEL